MAQSEAVRRDPESVAEAKATRMGYGNTSGSVKLDHGKAAFVSE